MNDQDNKASDNESILIALDQISQTVDVMASVLDRLRNQLQKQENPAAEDQGQALRHDTMPGRILH